MGFYIVLKGRTVARTTDVEEEEEVLPLFAHAPPWVVLLTLRCQ